MTVATPSPTLWPRPQWRSTPAQALVLYFLFGEFDDALNVPGEQYRTRGMPAGISVLRQANRVLADWDGYPLHGGLGQLLRAEQPALAEQALAARDCVMLRGEIADPSSLDYLRDTLGVITGLLDRGGVAVVDPQILSLFDVGTWRGRYFGADRCQPRDQVLILESAETDPERVWVHTRGMRKFARPDLSIRHVPKALARSAGDLAGRFVDFQAGGGVIAEQHVVQLPGSSEPLRARHVADLHDGQFNNAHVEFDWPAA